MAWLGTETGKVVSFVALLSDGQRALPLRGRDSRKWRATVPERGMGTRNGQLSILSKHTSSQSTATRNRLWVRIIDCFTKGLE